MGTKDRPHYEVASTELARWLDRQGADRWWTVDGDPVLASRLDFPCPGDELASALRKLNKPLLLADKDENPEASGQIVHAEDLDRLVERLHYFGEAREVADRVLYLSWKGTEIDWMLVEDEATSESSSRDVRSQQETR